MSGALDPDAMPAWLASRLSTRESSADILAGVNDDDCTVIRFGDVLLVATTDYVNSRPIAIELGIGSFRTLGRILVASSLADLCGSGAEPKAFLTAVMMTRENTEKDFQDVMEGVREESRRWGVPVVGGDTKLGPSIALAGTAIGIARSERNLFLKYRARPGDLVWSSGCLGSCSAAVWGLAEQYGSDSWRNWAIDKLTVPELPLSKSKAVSDAELGRGGTDVSDGLGMDLDQLCNCSDVGVIINADQIPTAEETQVLARELHIPPWAFALGTGGEFQFLVTTDPKSRDRMHSMGFHLLGEVTAQRERLLRLIGGKIVALPTAGHRDVRNLTFTQEVQSLVQAAANAAK